MQYAGQIVSLLQQFSIYLNKDKNVICEGLLLIVDNIQKWYNEIAYFISKEIVKNMVDKGGKMTLEDAINIYRFMKSSKRRGAAMQSVYFLNDIENRYNSHKLKKLEKKLDINKLIEIRRLIIGPYDYSPDDIPRSVTSPRAFMPQAVNETDLFGEKDIAQIYGDPNRIVVLNDWLDSLRLVKDEIENKIWLVCYEIGCPHIQALESEYRKQSNLEEQ